MPPWDCSERHALRAGLPGPSTPQGVSHEQDASLRGLHILPVWPCIQWMGADGAVINVGRLLPGSCIQHASNSNCNQAHCSGHGFTEAKAKLSADHQGSLHAAHLAMLSAYQHAARRYM
eukprot:365031-Chlamydomonas_euryale.AAC.9